MIFLIDYDVASGKPASLTSFADAERSVAERARLELEIRLSRESVQREVVLLEADNEQALQATHRRYFANLAELVEDPAACRPRGSRPVTAS